jgi:beta-lactam-binding protein with PASTA domain
MPVVIQLTASQAEHRLAAQGVHSDQITIRRASVGSDGQPKQYPSGWVIAESPTVGTPLTTSTKIGLMVAP